MNILIDGRLYGLENAGLGRYVINLVSELSKLDSKNNYTILLRKKYFETLDLPENWDKVLSDFHHYSFTEQFKLFMILKKVKPDLVHFPHFNVPIFYSGKYVVTIHDLLMHKQTGLEATTLNPLHYLIKRVGYRTVFRLAALKSGAIIVPSNAVKKELEDFYPEAKDKTYSVYEGLDANVSYQNGSKFDLDKWGVDKPYFVYVGNAYPHKNLKRLIEAISSQNSVSGKKSMLVIVTSRSIFLKRLKKLIKQIVVERFVKIVGYVTDAEMADLYKHSVGLVFPSVSEGFGLPGLEAMSSGTLVFASEIPVFKEVYKNNAIYFNPFDFTSIQAAIDTGLKMDKKERDRRISEAGEFVKIYSWSKMAKQTLQIYEKTYGNSIRQGK